MAIKKIETTKHPLAEVFGFPISNFSTEAKKCRDEHLCPFQNMAPCTKDKADDPLGVCTIYGDNIDDHAIICPIRLKQDNSILNDASSFFFPSGVKWTSIDEVRLGDKRGKSAGNIDTVLITTDDSGNVVDFGALEIQAVYISGNVRKPFIRYMEHTEKWRELDWTKQKLYPRADYLSSSRKRLVPQLIFKGAILNKWNKKMAVAVHKNFYSALPKLPQVAREKADIAWMIYKLDYNKNDNVFNLVTDKIIYTELKPALKKITTSTPGPLDDFISYLQRKLNSSIKAKP